MRKKSILPLVSFVFLCHLAIAQETATVSGLVVDKSTDTSLPYATVLIKSKRDSTTVSGIMSGLDGRFTLAGIPKGNFVVVISFVGFQSYETALLVGDLNKVFDLGKISLAPQSENLGDVVVVAQKEIVSSGLDKKSFDLKENISQQSGSVLEAMRNLPGITVSPDGKVALRGSEQVSVLIDGNQSSLTGYGNQKGLDNIPAANIERIEIINNPSAKYNAMGMAGIINIIYKKEKSEGLHGEMGLAVGIGEWWQRKENLPRISEKYSQTPKVNPNLSLNYRTKKTNWFFQGDGMVRRRINANEFFTRDYSDPATTDVASQFLENRTQKLYNIKGGLDWFLNDKNTLTLFALWQDEYHIDKGDVPYDNLETGKRIRLWTWREDERTKFINYAASFHHKFSQPGHELKMGYMYTGGGEDEYFPFGDSSAVRNDTDDTFLTIYEYVNAMTLDYVKPLRSGRLEIGSRISLRNIPLTYTLTPGQNSILDPYLGAWSEYQEDVYAFYTNFIREGSKIDVEAGLRFEPSFVKFDLDNANIYYNTTGYEYFPVFPNVRLSFKLNETNTISLFHNRRVDRPGEFDVRPFPKYDDPEILKTGNPNLRPQFTNTFEVAYKKYWNSGSLYSSFFYRDITNIFSRIYTIDSNTPSIVNTIPANLGHGTNGGLELAFQQTLTSYWKLNSSVTVYRNTINAFSGTAFYPYEQTFQSAASEITTGNFKVNSTWKLPRQIEFQLTSVYYAADIIPQGKVKPRYSLDFGLKKTSKNNKLEWRLNVTDLLNTFAIRKEITGNGVTVKAHNYYETQVVNVGVRWKF